MSCDCFPECFYGVTTTLAFILAFALCLYNTKHVYFRRKDLVSYFVTMAPVAIFGARLMYVLVFPQRFRTFYHYIALHEGGFVFYGGFLGVFIISFVFARIKKLDIERLFDLCAPSMALGHAVGRVGCLLNSCCYGIPTKSVQIYRISTDLPSVYRHPTQLYEIAFLLLLAGVLQKLLGFKYRIKDHCGGIVAGIYLISYTLWRFLVEFIRGDNRGAFYTGLQLSVSQVISLGLLVVATAWMYRCIIKNSGKHNEQVRKMDS